MGRTAAMIWHASSSIIAAGLYFLFVLPRWWELTGYTPHTLGTVLRVVAAILIALTALPVVFTLLRARGPQYRTPQLALTLLVASIVAHVLAGVLIAGTAISEIWLNPDDFGPWLFGIYGAAAAVALLGIAALYLSFVAELPPHPPKPLKPETEKQAKRGRRSRRKGWKGRNGDDAAASVGIAEVDGVAEVGESDEAPTAGADEERTEAVETEVAETGAGEAETVETVTSEVGSPVTAEDAEQVAADSAASDPELVPTESQPKLRPSGKRRTKCSD